MRAYDAKPPTGSFPWSRFSTQITPLALTNVSGRLAAVASRSSGAWQVTLYSYDTDGLVSISRTYTEANGGASVLTALNTTTQYVRDLRDALTERQVTVGSNAFNQWYDYDNRGLLWKVFATTASTKPASADATYTYRPDAAPATRLYLGDVQVPLDYTIRGQLERIGSLTSTTLLFAAEYDYHPNGTIEHAEFRSNGSPAAHKRFRYSPVHDGKDQLTSAQYAYHNGSSYTSSNAYRLNSIAYDLSGNLTSLTRYRDNATIIDNLNYVTLGSWNRLGSITDAIGSTTENWDVQAGSFTYDANGNMKTAGAPYLITAATYDHANLPVSITSNGTTSTYRYNEESQRIAKRVGSGNTEVYIIEGPTTLGVFSVNGSGTPTSWHFNILAGDRVVGRQPNGALKRYYHKDLLGSTRAVVQSGSIVESYDYDPWGVLMPGRTLAGATKEGFTGKERDAETGLDYFGFRYYMSSVGRWTTLDPPADSFPSWSPYNYVMNNPVANTDPFGLCVGFLARLCAKAFLKGANWALGRALPFAGAAGRAILQFARPGAEPGPEDLVGGALRYANFAQRTYSETFDNLGRFGGQSIDDVASALRSGGIGPADVPIDYIVREGNTLILNTRSAQALERAGIPRADWNAVDRTGVEFFESLLTGQLQRNRLTVEGSATVVTTGN